jgi:SAM-dependent methyltransferase
VASAAGDDLSVGERDENLAEIRAEIAAYYSAKIGRFGATPLGVDWTCQATQDMRFVQLLKPCDFTPALSLNDLGCGYGALVAYLDRYHANCAIDYVGVDVSEAMVRQARRIWRGRRGVTFARGHAIERIADYSVASGIFNVQQDRPRAEWERFIAESLDNLHEASRMGFSVNFMRKPVGTSGREGIYYADAEQWARHCAGRFNAATNIREDYGLKEFTLHVRRLDTKHGHAPTDNRRRASSNKRR